MCSSVLWKTKGLPCAHSMRTMLISAKRLQLADFHVHWHTHWESSIELPDDRDSGHDADVGAMLLQRFMNFQGELSHPQWRRLAERITDSLEQDLPVSESSKPAVLSNPALLLTSKGRPTESHTRSRATAGLPMRLQKSSTGRIKSIYEMKERKCGLCGQVNACHDRRNCPQKQLQRQLRSSDFPSTSSASSSV